MTSQGSAHTRFRRALATGKPSIATLAALELPRVLLEDALRLVLLYRDAGDARFERAALRWAGRLCLELPAIGLAGGASALQALVAVSHGRDEQGAEALAAVLRAAKEDSLADAVNDWAGSGASDLRGRPQDGTAPGPTRD